MCIARKSLVVRCSKCDVVVGVFVVVFCVRAAGLWDVMSNSDIVPIVKSSTKLKIAAERLIAEAVLRGSKDNITVLIAHLG